VREPPQSVVRAQRRSIKTGALRETERTLAEKESELTKFTARLGETSATSDSQRIEIVSLKTQVENLKDLIDAETKGQCKSALDMVMVWYPPHIFFSLPPAKYLHRTLCECILKG